MPAFSVPPGSPCSQRFTLWWARFPKSSHVTCHKCTFETRRQKSHPRARTPLEYPTADAWRSINRIFDRTIELPDTLPVEERCWNGGQPGMDNSQGQAIESAASVQCQDNSQPQSPRYRCPLPSQLRLERSMVT